MDMLDQIMAWESGELSDAETVKFFAELIKNGMAWTLQGCYGRTAMSLINSGYITKKGELTEKGSGLCFHWK
jgi:hypothetical protein